MIAVKFIALFLEVIISLLMIVVILMQRSKGQGVGAVFGGGGAEAIFGAHIGNVLTKVTIVLAIIFMVNTTFLAWLGSQTSTDNSIVNEINNMPVPAQPVQQSAESPVLPLSTSGTAE